MQGNLLQKNLLAIRTEINMRNILLIVLKVFCTIVFYPLIFIITGFGLPLNDWLQSINLFQKYDAPIRLLLEEVNKKIGLLDSQVVSINRIGAILYSDESLKNLEEKIKESIQIELSFPNHFDPRQTYINIYELMTIDTKKYIILEIDYADFRLPEILNFFEIKNL